MLATHREYTKIRNTKEHSHKRDVDTDAPYITKAVEQNHNQE